MTALRPYIVFVVLLLMIGGFAFLLVTRDRPVHRVPSSTPDAGATGQVDGGAAAAGDAAPSDASARRDDAPEGDGGASTVGHAGDGGVAADGDVGAADGAPSASLDRPCRIVGLGWELLAPGLVANRGSAPGSGSRFTAEGLDVRIAATRTAQDAERALARGGAEEGGADVAIMPLPAFVAASERLRALDPRVFMVVGWSHGQEALFGSSEDALTSLPAAGEVRVAAEEGSTAAFLALFVLDLAGVDPSRVQTVEVRDEGARTAPFVAVEAGGAMPPDDGERHRLLTTTEATRLVPYVAVAPRGFVEVHGDAVAAVARAWRAGISELGSDVPAAARRIAALSGAPEALVLLERLGRIEAAGRGCSADEMTALEELYRHTHRLLRAGHALTAPAPETAPLHAATLRTGPEPVRTEGPGRGEGDAGATAVEAPAREVEPILVWHPAGRALEGDELVITAGFVASVFQPLSVRIAVRGPRARTDEAVVAVRQRYPLAAARVEAGTRVAGAGAASVELLPAP